MFDINAKEIILFTEIVCPKMNIMSLFTYYVIPNLNDFPFLCKIKNKKKFSRVFTIWQIYIKVNLNINESKCK